MRLMAISYSWMVWMATHGSHIFTSQERKTLHVRPHRVILGNGVNQEATGDRLYHQEVVVPRFLKAGMI